MTRVSKATTLWFVFGLAVALSASSPINALENQTVDRFLQLSSKFHAQLPRSRVARLSATQQKQRAVCILTRFEGRFGADGVSALMGLMSVLSQGAQFDDSTIVAFNDRFGPQYDQIVQRCTNAAGA